MINIIKNKYNNLSLTKKSVIWFTLATIIQNGILFLVTPLYTRMLVDEEYGVFSVYQSWQQIISIISVLALDRCIVVGFKKFENNRKEFLSSIQSLMTLLVVIFILIVGLFKNFFVDFINLPLYIIIIMLVVSLMNNTFNNWIWFERYTYDYKKASLIAIFSTLIMQIIATLSIIFINFYNKGLLLIISISLIRLVVYGLLYIFIFIKGKTNYNKEYWKFGLLYSIPIIPHAISQIILNSSDRIMIDKMCGREYAAYYGVIYSAAMVLNIIITSISSSVQPWYFEKIKQKDFKSIKKQTNNLLTFSALLSILISFLAPEILMIMAPSSYNSALWAFPSIAASIYFNSMYLYFSNIESYYEKPIYFSIATTIGAIVNIILNYLLIPIFGFIVAGYTTLVCYMLFAVMHYFFMKKICKKKLDNQTVFDIKYIFILSVFVVFITIGMTIIYSQTFLRYFLTILLIIIIYIFRNKLILIFKNILKK